MAQGTERIALTGSKGTVTKILSILGTLALGGGITLGGYKALAPDAEATPKAPPVVQAAPCPTCIDKAEVVSIARDEAAKAVTTFASTLIRIESKVDKQGEKLDRQGEDMSTIKIDVGVLKATSRGARR